VVIVGLEQLDLRWCKQLEALPERLCHGDLTLLKQLEVDGAARGAGGPHGAHKAQSGNVYQIDSAARAAAGPDGARGAQSEQV